jgi:hypothetical protein
MRQPAYQTGLLTVAALLAAPALVIGAFAVAAVTAPPRGASAVAAAAFAALVATGLLHLRDPGAQPRPETRPRR